MSNLDINNATHEQIIEELEGEGEVFSSFNILLNRNNIVTKKKYCKCS